MVLKISDHKNDKCSLGSLKKKQNEKTKGKQCKTNVNRSGRSKNVISTIFYD